MRKFGADCEEVCSQGAPTAWVLQPNRGAENPVSFLSVFWQQGQALRGANWKSLQRWEGTGARGRSLIYEVTKELPLRLQ